MVLMYSEQKYGSLEHGMTRENKNVKVRFVTKNWNLEFEKMKIVNFSEHIYSNSSLCPANKNVQIKQTQSYSVYFINMTQ